MVVLFIFLLTVISTRAHNDRISDDKTNFLELDSSRSESATGSASDETQRELQREHQAVAHRKSIYVPEQVGDGLSIDFPGSLNDRAKMQSGGFRRKLVEDASTEAATTTTPVTSTVYPPMNVQYRRIYNPDESATIEDFPFMAALLVNKELWCGAVVLDRDRILTAAHCLQLQYNNRFFREYVKMLTVRVGSTNATSGGEVLRVTEISFHPNYKPDTLDFNVALLRVHKNITFGKKEPHVYKIEYIKDNIIPIDHNITFLGWGSVLDAAGRGGDVLLQKVKLPVYDFADCQGVYGRELVTRSNFCAGYITVSKNVCNHDAGGPAIMDNVLVGILSFSSRRCDTPDQPAVFTSLGALVPWLEGKL